MIKGVLTAVLVLALVPGAAWAMGGFEYYDQTPDSAWANTTSAVLGVVGPVTGRLWQGRAEAAEDTPKVYRTRRFSITLPPGWAARPVDNEHRDVVFYPRDKQVGILVEVTFLEGGLDLMEYSQRYVKWLDAKGRGYGAYALISSENTLQADLPCSIVASSFEVGGHRLIQVAKMLEKGGGILTVKCVADYSTWASNYPAFKETLASLR